MIYQWWQNGNMIGGLAREAAKQPIIRAKRLRAKVKNWGASPPPGSATLDMYSVPGPMVIVKNKHFAVGIAIYL